MEDQFTAFMAESNRIEGILRPPTEEEVDALQAFVCLTAAKVQDVQKFVYIIQPNAVLRSTRGIPGVQVGGHIAPPSGPRITADLMNLLDRIDKGSASPWEAHVVYETLHPFTDGNGRSGRAVWLWHMRRLGLLIGALKLGFLHSFYYQTLAASH